MLDQSRTVEVRLAPNGLRFGIGTDQGRRPLPTVINLASTVSDAFAPAFLQAGALLGTAYRFVGVELPCHGADRRPGEPPELSGWACRVDAGEDFVAPFCAQLRGLVDLLIEERWTEPEAVVLAGTSRGGFLALHAACGDRRVRAVTAYAPVIDLRRLREFERVTHPLADELNVLHCVDALAGRPVFLVIGDRDHRVGTDATVAFAKNLSRAAEAAGVESRVALHVLSEPGGHTTPPDGPYLAARWTRRMMGAPGDALGSPQGLS